jgi:Domain of unknown function (DUF4178)
LYILPLNIDYCFSYLHMSFPLLNCPSCGALLELKYRHSRMVVCRYCGQTSYINANTLTAVGTPILLADYGSVLSVGKKGKINGKPFEVLGRLRFDYEDGFWDEWLISLDGQWDVESWLQEDEGEFTLFRKQAIAAPPAYYSLQVGTMATIGDQKTFISEKNKAVINGGEGELPFQIIAGEEADFVDGIIIGKKMTFSLEYMPGEIMFTIGEPLNQKDLHWN